MKLYALVMLGGAVGSALRYFAAGSIDRWAGVLFPWGTVVVNILGSFIIGLFTGMTGPEGAWRVSQELRVFITVGCLGGFTTFSSFSLQTMLLWQEGNYWHAAGNVLLSVTLCFAGTALGLLLGPHLSRVH